METPITQLQELWRQAVEVWQTSAFGVDIGRLLVAFLVFGIFFAARGLMGATLLSLLTRLTARTRTKLDDALVQSMREPISLVPVVIGLFFALDVLALGEPYAWIGNTLVKSLIAFAIFWGFYRLVEPASALIDFTRRWLPPTLVDWLMRAAKALFVFMGGATILELWGVQVAPLLAGLGLVGVAVALGAQDLFKNLIAGLLIILERRFFPGDWIKVDGLVEGTVERINFRSTTVRRFDKAPVHVPNTVFADQAVINFSAMSHRRIFWTIAVEYRTRVDQLRQIRDGIEAYIRGCDDFAQPPDVPLFVRIDSFNDSSIDIMLYCFTRTIDWGEWLEIKERLAYRIKEIVEGSGAGFAFPSRSLYVEGWPEGAPDRFDPPQGQGRALGAGD